MVTLDRLRISPDVMDDGAAGANVLRLPRVTLAEMLTHIEAGYPNEACGVLAGDAAGRVTRHFPAVNAAETPRTFSEIAPEQLLTIWNELDAHDWEMLAYYHSHPETPAYPSPRDVRWSQNWPGMFYIIFSLATPDAPVVRAFLISGADISEYRIMLED